MSKSELPLTTDTLLDAIRSAERPLSKRDLAHQFGLRDAAKIELKRLLKQMQEAGMIEQLPTRCYAATDPEGKDADGKPSVTILRVSEVTLDGDVYAQPASEDDSELPERILLEPGNHEHDAPAEGDRVLCQVKYRKDGSVTARVMRKLGAIRDRMMLGRAVKAGPNWWLQPVNRKDRDEYMLVVPLDRLGEIEHGALVEAIVEESKASLKRPRARLHAVIGHDDDPKAISLIALHEQGLRVEFPQAVIDETVDMVVPPLGKREDLRKIPLVTIDGADARDFDDAVFAESTDDGFHLIVAIADVAHYVRTGNPLDREAYKRGNSTYFPDRVLPMLPEKLSNDLCSLRPKEDRACLAMHMYIDMDGKLLKYRVVRGLMRSVARLTYEQVQAAFDGVTDATTEMLVADVLNPLRDAYKVLDAARQKRGALDIDMPERQILIDAKGNMTGVRKRARFDSHKLVEEFMILANVAAAMSLEAKTAPCIYRIHDTPSAEKLDSARNFLEGFGLSLAKGAVVKPALFNGILHKVQGKDFAPLVNQIILRSQAQAVYSPDNIGHFGLALAKYAHFTSPIRRYADLAVHRSLIKAYGLGDGGMDQPEAQRLAETADHISKTERSSMEAERASVDRFTAAWLAQRVGESFTGRISGVTRFGLFISLDETGADGLVPIRMLPQDYYIHSEEQHALIGRRTGRLFRLCAPVRIRVVEADRLTGSSVFELLDAEQGAEVPGYHGRTPHLGRGRGDRRDKKSKGPKGKDGKGGRKPFTKSKHKKRFDG